ncbi:hypothetical protein [Halomicrococcus gelatinilyticus]|uniref:hypothetical protein n=1 Tax=Halomicrococcus gelatinilyticus TaxID=1702103 RepID=UPI002E136C62
MTETPNGWSDSGYEHRRVWNALVTLGKGTATGVTAGLATFVYVKQGLMAADVDPVVLLVITALCGAYAHLLSNTLRESIRVGMTGFFAGVVAFVGVWISPLWVLHYSPTVRDVLLPSLLGSALVGAMFLYAAAYFSGYLTAVVVDAYT